MEGNKKADVLVKEQFETFFTGPETVIGILKNFNYDPRIAEYLACEEMDLNKAA